MSIPSGQHKRCDTQRNCSTSSSPIKRALTGTSLEKLGLYSAICIFLIGCLSDCCLFFCITYVATSMSSYIPQRLLFVWRVDYLFSIVRLPCCTDMWDCFCF